MRCAFSFFFFFNDTATTEIYTLSLHDALPISFRENPDAVLRDTNLSPEEKNALRSGDGEQRSEEHTSELQSQSNLVCRLLLEKKKPCCRHMYCQYRRIYSPCPRPHTTTCQPPI